MSAAPGLAKPGPGQVPAGSAADWWMSAVAIAGCRRRRTGIPPGNPRGSWPGRSPRPVSSRWAAVPFGTVPDAAQHPLRHQEADRCNGLDEQPSPPPRVRVSLAHQQARCPARLLSQGKGPAEVVRRRCCARRPATAEDQRPALLHNGYTQPDLRGELDLVPDLDVLPLWDDPVRAADVTADQVLECVIAIEAAPPLPELGDPRPDLICRGVDGDGTGCHQVGGRDQVIAGQGGAGFFIGRTPAELPRPAYQDVGSRRAADDGSARCICPALHSTPFAAQYRAPSCGLTPSWSGSGQGTQAVKVNTEAPRAARCWRVPHPCNRLDSRPDDETV